MTTRSRGSLFKTKTSVEPPGLSRVLGRPGCEELDHALEHVEDCRDGPDYWPDSDFGKRCQVGRIFPLPLYLFLANNFEAAVDNLDSQI